MYDTRKSQRTDTKGTSERSYKLQLSQNPAMFEKASQLFLCKYERFEDFTKYFAHQWLKMNRNWYEGACSDIGIKDEKTFRKRLPLQQFFIQLLTWVESWGNRFVAVANVISMNPVIDLPLTTKSYQWARMNKKNKKLCTCNCASYFKDILNNTKDALKVSVIGCF